MAFDHRADITSLSQAQAADIAAGQSAPIATSVIMGTLCIGVLKCLYRTEQAQ
jgi:hypothetical protein